MDTHSDGNNNELDVPSFVALILESQDCAGPDPEDDCMRGPARPRG